MADASIYTVGGTVQTNRSGVYISRQADEELLALCREGKFAYVLTPRQMGKSSLMVRTARQLRTEGIESVMIDLTGIGTQVTNPEQWYLGLLIQIEAQLMLNTDVYDWWQEHAYLGFTQRLTEFFQRVLLVEITASVVIFIDEIDTTLSLDFTDDFYAAIRYLYVSRASISSEFERLSFVLFGVATPGDLIRDPKRTPFNVGQRVDLTDFTLTEAEPLASGLGLPTDKAQQVLHWVLDWTGGHPYLSQRICSILSQQPKKDWSKADIHRIVSRNFFGAKSEEDNNLQFVRDMLTKRAPDKAVVLSIYREIRRGKRRVADEEQSIAKSHLKLSGVVKRKNGVLKVRNPIYQRVFDLKWVNQHLPLNLRDFWQRYKPALPYVAGLLIFSIFMAGMALYANTQRLNAEKALKEVERQRNLASLEFNIANSKNLLSYQPLEGLVLAISGIGQTTGQNSSVLSQVFGSVQSNLLSAVELARERNIFRGHEDIVMSVAFSPDGQYIVSGSDDKTVRLWDKQGKQIGEPFRGHEDKVKSVAFSPDGQYIVSGSRDRTVRLWNKQGKQIGEPFRGHEGQVNSVAFSPDGQYIASGSRDRTVRLWNKQGKQIGEPFCGHEGFVWSVAFSPDGQYIASGSYDRTVRLWNRQGKQIGEPFRGHEGFVWPVAFSPDGQYIASGSHDRTVRLWNRQGKQIGEPFHGHKEEVHSVAFSPDGQYIVSSDSDGIVQLWDLQGNAISEPFRGHTNAVNSVAFSPNGKYIVSGSADRTMRLWDRQGYVISIPFQGHKDKVKSVAFSPDGRYIVSGSNDKTVRLWDKQGKQIGQPFRGHEDKVKSVAFSLDGQYIVSGGNDKTVRLWNKQGKQIGEPFRGHEGKVHSVAFSLDGQYIASGGGDRTVRLWNRQGKQIGEPFRGYKGEVYSVAFSPDSQYIVSGGGDRTVRLWNRQGKQIGEPFRGHENFVCSVAFSPDGQYIVSGGGDTTVRLWNRQGKQIGEPFRGHEKDVSSVVFSPDGQYIVSGSRDRTVRLWDLQGKAIGVPFRNYMDAINSVAFSPDGDYIIIGSDDKTMRLWQVGNWQTWLRSVCERLHDHPIFVNPKNVFTRQEQVAAAMEAKSICQNNF